MSRFLSPDVDLRCALHAQPEPGIVFNYLGWCDWGLGVVGDGAAGRPMAYN